VARAGQVKKRRDWQEAESVAAARAGESRRTPAVAVLALADIERLVRLSDSRRGIGAKPT
jgi:hypothetical protein